MIDRPRPLRRMVPANYPIPWGIPLLSADREHELADRARAGDRDARDALVTANLRLVVRLAAAKARRCDTPGEDLVGAGVAGLIRAAETFDPVPHGTRFIAYAIFYIRRDMELCRKLHERPIRIKSDMDYHSHHAAQFSRARRAAESVLSARFVTTLDDDRGRTVDALSLVADPVEPVPDGLSDRVWVADLLRRLPARERRVIVGLFGLDDGRERTLREVGRPLGVSGEAVRRVRNRALVRLREISRA